MLDADLAQVGSCSVESAVLLRFRHSAESLQKLESVKICLLTLSCFPFCSLTPFYPFYRHKARLGAALQAGETLHPPHAHERRLNSNHSRPPATTINTAMVLHGFDWGSSDIAFNCLVSVPFTSVVLPASGGE